jgi:hypothetical protein
VPSAAALDEIERAFAACGAPVQIELAHLADPAICAVLTERGYRLTSFENVLALALEGESERVIPPGVEVRPSGDDEFNAWFDVVADGVAHPDTQGLPAHEEFPREVVERAERDFAAAGVVRYVALRDGAIAGGASFRMAGASRSSPARRPCPRTAAGVSIARCSWPGWRTRRTPAVTSPSSPPSRRRRRSRTCSAGASTCSTPAPPWSSSRDVYGARDRRGHLGQQAVNGGALAI